MVVLKPGHKQLWLTSQSSAHGAGSPAMEYSRSTTVPHSISRPLPSHGSAPSRSSYFSSSERSAAALSMQASSDQSTSPARFSSSSESSPCPLRRISGNSFCRKDFVSVSPTACISVRQCPSSAHTLSESEHWLSASPRWDLVPAA